MIKRVNKKFIYSGLILVILLALFLLPGVVSAQTGFTTLGGGAEANLNLGTGNLEDIVVNIINFVIGFLGLIAVVIVIYGGFIYLTSAGEPEKITKAKKIIIGGVIGVVIILLSFVIIGFVLGLITNSAGGGTSGGQCNPADYPQVCNTDAYCTWYQYCSADGYLSGCTKQSGCGPSSLTCQDPNLAQELAYICGLKPTSGQIGQNITIEGGDFGSYDSANKKVYFKQIISGIETEANIVFCNNNPMWWNNRIKLQVPQLSYDPADNVFEIIIKVAGTPSIVPVGFEDKNRFTLTSADPYLGPAIACIDPDQGTIGTQISIYGQRFGSSPANLIFPETVLVDFSANPGNWTDNLIIANVPDQSISGDVVVSTVDGLDAVEFIVTCTGADDLAECPGSGCCRFDQQCASTEYCRGVGDSCDNNSADAACQIGDCGQSLYCASDDCACHYLPRIDWIEPADGAPGTCITIGGQGFGETANQVRFIDDGGNSTLALPPTNCPVVWQDGQIVVEVPNVALGDYSIEVENIDNLTTNWEDSFTVNDVIRPCLCQVTPAVGEFQTAVILKGRSFGASKDATDQALIGGIQFNNTPYAWSDSEISNALVPNVVPDELPVQVKKGELVSNPVYYAVTPSAIAPTITLVEPSDNNLNTLNAPAGQYLTITGFNFGNQPSQIKFKNVRGASSDYGSWANGDTAFPDECQSIRYWSDKQIIVKVPQELAGLLDNTFPTLESKIVVRVPRGADLLDSNEWDLTVCRQVDGNCDLTPGVCLIEPQSGPVGTKGVTLYGENLGRLAGSARVSFYNNINVLDLNTLNWQNNQVGTGSEESPMTVPTGATTGSVYLYNEAGLASNPVTFEVADCRAPLVDCASGVCCPDGSCRSDCGEITATCNYKWSFSTTEEFGPPRVVQDSLCEQTTQSPSPFGDSQENCVNTLISARFENQDSAGVWQPAEMDFSTVSNNVEVYQCNGPGEKEDCTSLIAPVSVTPIDGDNTGFVFDPSPALLSNTWYQVFLREGMKSTLGILLDGNRNFLPGGEYTWYFKVRDSIDDCAVENVLVTPNEAVLDLNKRTKEYNAWPVGPECNILSPTDYSWDWYKMKNGVRENADVTNVATITLNDILQPIGSIDPKQIARVASEGWTYVSAALNIGGTKIADENNLLVVDYNRPTITSFTPNNGLMNPNVNAYTTIYGRNFGGSPGQVLFGNVTAWLADCPNAWSDKRIQVIVPKDMPVLPEKQVTFDPKPQKRADMVLFHDFNDASDIISKDQVADFDALMFNANINADKFGNAVWFNGDSTYAQIRNSDQLDFSKGAIEFWFDAWRFDEIKKQTLFSINNGTADSPATQEFYLELNNSTNSTLTELNLVVNNQGNNYTLTTIKLVRSIWWNHIVVNYNLSENQLELFMNGHKFYEFNIEFADNATELGNLATAFNGLNVNNLYLGVRDLGENNKEAFYNGLIDNFAIYNGTLTEDEITANYGIKSGQVMLLDFEGLGDQIIDSSANAFDGIEINEVAKFSRVDDGKFGKAAKIENTYFDLLDDSLFSFNNQVSVIGWFKVNNLSDIGSVFNASGIGFSIVSAQGNDFCFSVPTRTPDNQFIRGTACIDESNIKLGDWNFFAGVYDNQKVKLYLNSFYSETENPGRIHIPSNFGRVWLADKNNLFDGQLDNLAVYNYALSDAKVSSYRGAVDNSKITVKTTDGEFTTSQTFKFSENVFPFVCDLEPNSGKLNSGLRFIGDNFGDAFKTIFRGQEYGIASYLRFEYNPLIHILQSKEIVSWTNKAISFLNPIGVNDLPGVREVFLSLTIDPYSEPYNDKSTISDIDGYGQWNEGEAYANQINPENLGYDKHYYDTDFDGDSDLPYLQSDQVSFYIPPVITGLSPDNGAPGQWVTITGYNFGDYQTQNSNGDLVSGKVYFYSKSAPGNFIQAQLAPCANITWSDSQIIVFVPAGADPGNIFVETAPAENSAVGTPGILSNGYFFEVNDKPVGPGLCTVYAGWPEDIPTPVKNETNRSGQVGDKITAEGVNFGTNQGQSELYFASSQPADEFGVPSVIPSGSDWSDTVVKSSIPLSSQTGSVSLVKREPAGDRCVGFSIFGWCPLGAESEFVELQSNSVRFVVSDICQSGYLFTEKSRDDLNTESSVPYSDAMEVYALVGGQKVSFENIDLDLTASDGTGAYFYAMARADSHNSTNDINTIYKIGTGQRGSDLGRIYNMYQYNYLDNNRFKYNPTSLEQVCLNPADDPNDPENNETCLYDYIPDRKIISKDFAGMGAWSLVGATDGSLYYGLEVQLIINPDTYQKMSSPKWYVPKIKFKQICLPHTFSSGGTSYTLNNFNCQYSFEYKEIPQAINVSRWPGYTINRIKTNIVTSGRTDGALFSDIFVNLGSNGDKIFSLSRYENTLNPGYTIQIFDANTWQQIDEFSIKRVSEHRVGCAPRGSHISAVDDRYIYVTHMSRALALDWQAKDWAVKDSDQEGYIDCGYWQSCEAFTAEKYGHFDWVNKRFWLGAYKADTYSGLQRYYENCQPEPDSKMNRLYRYSQCPFNYVSYCLTDDDCNACGVLNSTCENNRCTPYIEEITPTAGDNGSWVTLHGCYFGCDEGNGEVYFAAPDSYALPANTRVGDSSIFKKPIYSADTIGTDPEDRVPACGENWQCSSDGSNDSAIVGVPSGFDSGYKPELTTAYGLSLYEEDDRWSYYTAKLFTSQSLEPFILGQTTANVCQINPSEAQVGWNIEVIGELFGEPAGSSDLVRFDSLTTLGETWQVVSSAVSNWLNNSIVLEVPQEANNLTKNENNKIEGQIGILKNSLLSNKAPFNIDFAPEGVQPGCNNGIVEAIEDCDFDQATGLPLLGGKTCLTQTGFKGNLTCNPSTCTFDTSDCICGDEEIGASEDCDGDLFNNFYCNNFNVPLYEGLCLESGFYAQSEFEVSDALVCEGLTGDSTTPCTIDSDLSCSDSCEMLFDGQPLCGNGVLNSLLVTEQCDGNVFAAGSQCVNYNTGPITFTGGNVSCASDCTLDFSSCGWCGNGILDTNEDCDPALDSNCTACKYPLSIEDYTSSITTGDSWCPSDELEIEIKFSTLVRSDRITKDNFTFSQCSSVSESIAQGDGLFSKVLAYFKNIFTKLVSLGRPTQAQVVVGACEADCVPLTADYSLSSEIITETVDGVTKNKTVVKVNVKNDRLDNNYNYQLTVNGDPTTGVKSQSGSILEEGTVCYSQQTEGRDCACGASGSSIIPDPAEYDFETFYCLDDYFNLSQPNLRTSTDGDFEKEYFWFYDIAGREEAIGIRVYTLSPGETSLTDWYRNRFAESGGNLSSYDYKNYKRIDDGNTVYLYNPSAFAPQYIYSLSNSSSDLSLVFDDLIDNFFINGAPVCDEPDTHYDQTEQECVYNFRDCTPTNPLANHGTQEWTAVTGWDNAVCVPDSCVDFAYLVDDAVTQKTCITKYGFTAATIGVGSSSGVSSFGIATCSVYNEDLGHPNILPQPDWTQTDLDDNYTENFPPYCCPLNAEPWGDKCICVDTFHNEGGLCVEAGCDVDPAADPLVDSTQSPNGERELVVGTDPQQWVCSSVDCKPNAKSVYLASASFKPPKRCVCKDNYHFDDVNDTCIANCSPLCGDPNLNIITVPPFGVLTQSLQCSESPTGNSLGQCNRDDEGSLLELPIAFECKQSFAKIDNSCVCLAGTHENPDPNIDYCEPNIATDPCDPNDLLAVFGRNVWNGTSYTCNSFECKDYAFIVSDGDPITPDRCVCNDANDFEANLVGDACVCKTNLHLVGDECVGNVDDCNFVAQTPLGATFYNPNNISSTYITSSQRVWDASLSPENWGSCYATACAIGAILNEGSPSNSADQFCECAVGTHLNPSTGLCVSNLEQCDTTTANNPEGLDISYVTQAYHQWNGSDWGTCYATACSGTGISLIDPDGNPTTADSYCGCATGPDRDDYHNEAGSCVLNVQSCDFVAQTPSGAIFNNTEGLLWNYVLSGERIWQIPPTAPVAGWSGCYALTCDSTFAQIEGNPQIMHYCECKDNLTKVVVTGDNNDLCQARILGTVVDISGAIITDATVKLMSGANQYTTKTGSDGFFRINVPPGVAYTLEVSKPCYQTSNTSLGLISENKNIGSRTLQALTYNVSGHVIDQDGDPIKGVAVLLPPDTNYTTGDDGYYEFTNVSPADISGIVNLQAQNRYFRYNRPEILDAINLCASPTVDINHDILYEYNPSVRVHLYTTSASGTFDVDNNLIPANGFHIGDTDDGDITAQISTSDFGGIVLDNHGDVNCPCTTATPNEDINMTDPEDGTYRFYGYSTRVSWDGTDRYEIFDAFDKKIMFTVQNDDTFNALGTGLFWEAFNLQVTGKKVAINVVNRYSNIPPYVDSIERFCREGVNDSDGDGINDDCQYITYGDGSLVVDDEFHLYISYDDGINYHYYNQLNDISAGGALDQYQKTFFKYPTGSRYKLKIVYADDLVPGNGTLGVPITPGYSRNMTLISNTLACYNSSGVSCFCVAGYECTYNNLTSVRSDTYLGLPDIGSYIEIEFEAN